MKPKPKRFFINDQVMSIIDQEDWVDTATNKKSLIAPANDQVLTVRGYGEYNPITKSHRIMFYEIPNQFFQENCFESIMTTAELYINLKEVKMGL